MTINQRGAVLGLTAVFASCLLAPATFADSASRQNNKNLWRNLAIGAGALGVYGAVNHNSTETILGAAGAAYAANRYEQERHSQSVHNSGRRYHRRGNYSGNSGQYYQPSVQGTHEFGDYPNVKYFNMNGHTYQKNLDSGDTYLVR
jgi:hypothetical protein